MDSPFDQPTIPQPGGRYQAGLKVFGGRFVLERRIGRGGMGEVWLATDTELGDGRALKFLPSEVAADPKALAQLRREAIAGRRLNHPRIVRVDDFHVDEEYAAVAMEYVKGKTLNALQAETSKGYFDVEEIQSWLRDVCDALEYAHEEVRLVHRDLKPSNIIIEEATGRAKVLDFGIARRIAETHTQLTGKEARSGTLAYSSPQQLWGGKGGPTDDIYALGCTIYELLTGAPPFFRGDLKEQIKSLVPPRMKPRRDELVEEAFIEPGGGEIPNSWENAVAKCLAKEENDRFVGIRSFREKLIGWRDAFGDTHNHTASYGESALRVELSREQNGLIPQITHAWAEVDTNDVTHPATSARPEHAKEEAPSVKPRQAAKTGPAAKWIATVAAVTTLAIAGFSLIAGKRGTVQHVPAENPVPTAAALLAEAGEMEREDNVLGARKLYQDIAENSDWPSHERNRAQTEWLRLHNVTGTLEFPALPDEVQIKIDGNLMHREGSRITGIELGRPKIEFELNGYDFEPDSIDASVTGKNTVPIGPVNWSRQYGTLEINSTPQGARIYLSGNDTRQVTPHTFRNLESGTFQYRLELASFESVSNTVTISAGQDRTVDIALTHLKMQEAPKDEEKLTSVRTQFYTLDQLFANASLIEKSGITKQDVLKMVQEKLKTEDLNPGAANGIPGPQTQRAIYEWQRSAGREPTGRLDDTDLESLGIAANLVQPKAAQNATTAPRPASSTKASANLEDQLKSLQSQLLNQQITPEAYQRRRQALIDNYLE